VHLVDSILVRDKVRDKVTLVSDSWWLSSYLKFSYVRHRWHIRKSSP